MMMPATATVTPMMIMITKMNRPNNSTLLKFPTKRIPTQTRTTTTTTGHNHRGALLVCSVSSSPSPPSSSPGAPMPEEDEEKVGESFGELLEYVVEKTCEVKNVVFSAVFADSDSLIQDKVAKMFPQGLVKPFEFCAYSEDGQWNLLMDTLDLLLDNMDRLVKTRVVESVGMIADYFELTRFLKTHDAWRQEISVGKCIEFHFRVYSYKVLDDDEKVSEEDGVPKFLRKLKSVKGMIIVNLQSAAWVS